MTDKQDTFNKKFLVFFFIALALSFFAGFYADRADSPEKSKSTSQTETEAYTSEVSHEKKVMEAVEEANKGVVSVKKRGETIGGSGFFVSSDGYILTNRHVVATEGDYYVLNHKGEKLDAEVVTRDVNRDLAFLKVEGNDFEVLPLADSDSLRLGQTVIAIGYTLGQFENSVSVGVVSGLGRDIWASGGRHLEFLEGVIQTDAAINLGNSGGPLINLNGEVIGINTAKNIGAENVGFATPINQARSAINSVLEKGKIVYPYLGIRYRMINKREAQRRGLSVDHGALIIPGLLGKKAVEPGTPAKEAGLQPGDIITSLNGQKLTMKNPLSEVIMDYEPGETVEIKYRREKEVKTVQVELAERTSD